MKMKRMTFLCDANPYWERLLNKAEMAFEKGQFSIVQELCEGAFGKYSEVPPMVLHLLGLSYFKLGEAEKCFCFLKKSLDISPNNAVFWANLGFIQLDLGGYKESISSLSHAVRLGAHSIPNLLSLSYASRLCNDFEAAIKYAVMALLTAEADDDRLICGASLLESGNEFLNELICRDILRKNPHHISANSQLALQLLRSEQYEEGWKLAEYRLQQPSHAGFPKPLADIERWQGQSLSGKSILLFGEEGYGDKIQFVRYVELLAQMGAVVDLAGIFKPLKRLFETIRGVRTVYEGLPAKLCGYDYWSPIQSTPAILNFKEAPLAFKKPYFEIEHGLISAWKKVIERVQPNDSRLKIGIVWQGRPTHPNDKHRSILLEDLLPLADMPNVQWYSLQHGDKSNALYGVSGTWKIIDLSERFDDFYETAALISQLDLVISIDSAIAHLSGALGIPTWVLLSRLGRDWRWGLAGKKSVWYPSMTLFRQTIPGDWSNCIADIQDNWAKQSGRFQV